MSSFPADQPKKKTFTEWLVQTLAWAAVLGMISWTAYLQGRVDKAHADNAALAESLATEKAEREGDNKVDQTHFAYIKDALNRIESKLK